MNGMGPLSPHKPDNADPGHHDGGPDEALPDVFLIEKEGAENHAKEKAAPFYRKHVGRLNQRNGFGVAEDHDGENQTGEEGGDGSFRQVVRTFPGHEGEKARK